jgi:hypothetical protein
MSPLQDGSDRDSCDFLENLRNRVLEDRSAQAVLVLGGESCSHAARNILFRVASGTNALPHRRMCHEDIQNGVTVMPMFKKLVVGFFSK